MNEQTKPSLKEFIESIEQAPEASVKITIENDLIASEEECKAVIDTHLEDFFLLFDVGISVLEELHLICKKEELGFLYIALTAKLCTQSIALRRLLRSGMMDAAKCLVRPFQETMDLLFACLGNKEFASKFGKTDVLYNNNDFWYKNISKGKIDKHIEELFNSVEASEEYKDYYFTRRKEMKSFLSESIHSSFNSVFSNYLMLTMDGNFSDSVRGKLQPHIPTHCLAF